MQFASGKLRCNNVILTDGDKYEKSLMDVLKGVEPGMFLLEKVGDRFVLSNAITVEKPIQAVDKPKKEPYVNDKQRTKPKPARKGR